MLLLTHFGDIQYGDEREHMRSREQRFPCAWDTGTGTVSDIIVLSICTAYNMSSTELCGVQIMYRHEMEELQPHKNMWMCLYTIPSRLKKNINKTILNSHISLDTVSTV
jgi:hypothetical protein